MYIFIDIKLFYMQNVLFIEFVFDAIHLFSSVRLI